MTGELGRLNIGVTSDGELAAGSITASAHDIKDTPLSRYGIPKHIDIDNLVRSRRLTLSQVTMSQVIAVVNRHYGFGDFIQQDTIQNDEVIDSRFLHCFVTEEQEFLNPQCDSRFRQQLSMGLPTV